MLNHKENEREIILHGVLLLEELIIKLKNNWSTCYTVITDNILEIDI